MFKDENPDNLLRVEFKGNQDELKSIDKKVYTELGIDVKMKVKEIENTSEELKTSKIEALTNSDIVDKFKVFCEQNDYSYEKGLTILKEVL